jgi:Tfp pilus assembly protein PilE
MRKALLIIAIVVLALVPVTAYALVVNSPARADVRAYYNGSMDRQELTQQQQAALDESHQESIDLRKETINKMVQDGLLTAEQAQQELQQLDLMAAYHAENGGNYGYGVMNGCYDLDNNTDSASGYYGRGMMRGFYDQNDSADSDGSYYGHGMMRGYNWN